jgi:hypothetical protein
VNLGYTGGPTPTTSEALGGSGATRRRFAGWSDLVSEENTLTSAFWTISLWKLHEGTIPRLFQPSTQRIQCKAKFRNTNPLKRYEKSQSIADHTQPEAPLNTIATTCNGGIVNVTSSGISHKCCGSLVGPALAQRHIPLYKISPMVSGAMFCHSRSVLKSRAFPRES